jgi:hypothetical protein
MYYKYKLMPGGGGGENYLLNIQQKKPNQIYIRSILKKIYAYYSLGYLFNFDH